MISKMNGSDFKQEWIRLYIFWNVNWVLEGMTIPTLNSSFFILQYLLIIAGIHLTYGNGFFLLKHLELFQLIDLAFQSLNG